MGRGKLRMELIKNEKARKTAFEKRKKGLMKAANELSTLCGVHIAMIINEPAQNSNNEPTIWPENREVVSKLIDSYKSKSSSNDCRYGTYNLPAFFKNQTEKVEDELNKLRKRTREMKYPNWDDRFNGCSQDELKGFVGKLTAKIDSARERIDLIKGSRSNNSLSLINPSVNYHHQPLVNHYNNGNYSNYVCNDMQEKRVHENSGFFDRNGGGNYGFNLGENRVYQNGGFDQNFGNYGWVHNYGLVGTGLRVPGNAGVSNGESMMSLTVPKVGPTMPRTNAPEFEQFVPYYMPNEVQMVGRNEQGLLMSRVDYIQSQRHGF